MKAFTLTVVVAMCLSTIGCGDEPEDEAAPAPAEVTRVASSLERKLTTPIAIPSDTAIGGSIDALVEERAAKLTQEPFLDLGATGKRCTIVRFVDDKGVEQMRHEKCEKGRETLRIGKLLYTDQNTDGKIDELTDGTGATYELYDDDFDGKVDRLVEAAERITTPIALSDFAPNVTITGGGKIASRAREDKDHDGKFDLESVTATTSFRIAQ